MPNSKLSPNEPWLHGASRFWCKKVEGQLHYLDRDYKVAKRKLASEVVPNCRTLQVLILAAILNSKGVHHDQEIES